MSIVNRSFTYKGKIKVSREDFNLAKKGIKTCTVRLGTLNVAKSITEIHDGTNSLRVKIGGVDNKRVLRELTDDDAQKEGFRTKNDLISDLKRYYPSIEPEQPVTVIYFELLN